MSRFMGIILITIVLGSVGCAAIQQAYQDKKLSDSTPLAVGERSPYERGASIAQPLSGLPYGAGIVAVPLVGSVIGWYLAWKRGRKIRLSQPVSSNPITGNAGKSLGLENVVQHIADLRAGVFEVGKEGSGLKRGWKMAILGGLATALAPLLEPIVHNLALSVTSHPPIWLTGVPLVLAISGLAFLEKQLSKVLPVVDLINTNTISGAKSSVTLNTAV